MKLSREVLLEIKKHLKSIGVPCYELMGIPGTLAIGDGARGTSRDLELLDGVLFTSLKRTDHAAEIQYMNDHGIPFSHK